MSRLQKSLAALLGVVFVVLLVGWWNTTSHTPVGTATSTTPTQGIDDSAYALAQQLAARAADAAEQGLAQSALRLSDHDLDLSFTAALRQLEAHPETLSGDAAQIEARVRQAQQLYDADRKRAATLTASLAHATATDKDSLQDELDLVNSQVDLEKDELEDANQSLEDMGGNPSRRIARQMQDHNTQENAVKVGSAVVPITGLGSRGLVGDWRNWHALQQTSVALQQAAALNSTSMGKAMLDRQTLAAAIDTSKSSVTGLAAHTKSALDAGVANAAPAPVAAVAPVGQTHADARQLLGQTRQIGADQNQLALLDQRIVAKTSLASVYDQWRTLLDGRSRELAHTMFAGLALIVAILTLLVLLERGLQRLLHPQNMDRRTGETVRSLTRVGLQVLGVLIILFLLIGIPSEFGTVLGLIGAGLTVALKDFIVAIVGWAVLMGRNGIRLGDWVEINGVSGEVIELGLFRTVLLETGSWSDAAHPTGRRVTFTNSFAIEGHYFNFSTSGQWLWDELKLVVPAGRDPHAILDSMRDQVNNATAAGARQAEQEWRRAVPGQHGQQFSGEPAFNLKPIIGGVELSVRYLTRANERVPLRTALYQAAVDLLGQAPALAK